MDQTETEGLADAFFGAFVERDVAALERLYHPDFVMRSPTGTRKGADHLDMMRAGKIATRDLRYEDIVRHVFNGGFVQQHTVRGVLPSGSELRMRACVIVRIVEGRFRELDEYYDPTPLRHEPWYQDIAANAGKGDTET